MKRREAEQILEDAVLVTVYQIDPYGPVSVESIVAKLRENHPTSKTSVEKLERQVAFAVLRLRERGLMTADDPPDGQAQR